MILVFDDNKFRLDEICKKLRYANLPVMGTDYTDYDYYVKPIITILINPVPSEIYHLVNAPGTICILVLKRKIPQAKFARNVIINSEAKITPEQVKEIIYKEYGYDLKLDEVNHILIDEECNDIYFGAKNLYLTRRQYQIVRFLAYNKGKIFSIDDILDYLHIRKWVLPKTFSYYVSMINLKCLKQNREHIIIRHPYGYGITKVTGILPNK